MREAPGTCVILSCNSVELGSARAFRPDASSFICTPPMPSSTPVADGFGQLILHMPSQPVRSLRVDNRMSRLKLTLPVRDVMLVFATSRSSTHNDDQKTGVEIVRKAISWPSRQIARSARSWSGRNIFWRTTPTHTAMTHSPASMASWCRRVSSSRPKWCARRCKVRRQSRACSESHPGDGGARRRSAHPIVRAAPGVTDLTAGHMTFKSNRGSFLMFTRRPMTTALAAFAILDRRRERLSLMTSFPARRFGSLFRLRPAAAWTFWPACSRSGWRPRWVST